MDRFLLAAIIGITGLVAFVFGRKEGHLKSGSEIAVYVLVVIALMFGALLV
jgi:hypothetical protein